MRLDILFILKLYHLRLRELRVSANDLSNMIKPTRHQSESQRHSSCLRISAMMASSIYKNVIIIIS